MKERTLWDKRCPPKARKSEKISLFSTSKWRSEKFSSQSLGHRPKESKRKNLHQRQRLDKRQVPFLCFYKRCPKFSLQVLTPLWHGNSNYVQQQLRCSEHRVYETEGGVFHRKQNVRKKKRSCLANARKKTPPQNHGQHTPYTKAFHTKQRSDNCKFAFELILLRTHFCVVFFAGGRHRKVVERVPFAWTTPREPAWRN